MPWEWNKIYIYIYCLYQIMYINRHATICSNYRQSKLRLGLSTYHKTIKCGDLTVFTTKSLLKNAKQSTNGILTIKTTSWVDPNLKYILFILFPVSKQWYSFEFKIEKIQTPLRGIKSPHFPSFISQETRPNHTSKISRCLIKLNGNH